MEYFFNFSVGVRDWYSLGVYYLVILEKVVNFMFNVKFSFKI